mmetsp:Transcript_4789/g.7239  ORF Transcript_4789/g.7239 Transcript_4789/m.7239 type:complete len:219 (+) Transcript_4789:332-988(+)
MNIIDHGLCGREHWLVRMWSKLPISRYTLVPVVLLLEKHCIGKLLLLNMSVSSGNVYQRIWITVGNHSTYSLGTLCTRNAINSQALISHQFHPITILHFGATHSVSSLPSDWHRITSWNQTRTAITRRTFHMKVRRRRRGPRSITATESRRACHSEILRLNRRRELLRGIFAGRKTTALRGWANRNGRMRLCLIPRSYLLSRVRSVARWGSLTCLELI